MHVATAKQPQASPMRALVPLQVPVLVDPDKIVMPNLPCQN